MSYERLKESPTLQKFMIANSYYIFNKLNNIKYLKVF